MLTDQRLREIKERCERASEGPWFDCYKKGRLKNWVAGKLQQENGVIGHPIICSRMLNRDNADFIAHARQDIPDLVAEVEELKNILSSIKAVFGGIRTFCPVCRMGPDMEGIIHHKKDCRLGKALGRV